MSLEPLHPAGRIERVLVLGSSAPAALLPPDSERVLMPGADARDAVTPPEAERARAGADLAVTPPEAERAGIDLALIAPSPAEARSRGWLERAAGDGAAALAPGGFVYALVPRGRRAAMRRRLRAAGLAPALAVAQLPDAAAPRQLVPLRRAPWRYALRSQIEQRPWARRALLGLGSGALAAELLPSVGLLARQPADVGGAWVEQLAPDARPVADLVVTTSWRGPSGPLVVTCFAPGEPEPWAVAKLAAGAAAEADALARLGDAGGARVPRLLGRGIAGARPALLETVVEGRSAATLLAREPGRLAHVTEELAGWLERWNRATVATAPAAARLDAELLSPAAELATELPEGYAGWLAERTAALAGAELPLVARHNDLTMWNVRLDGADRLGILDWADAEEAGLPLTDLIYAGADAAAACDGYRDRVAAGRRSLAELERPRERLRQALGLSPEAAELCEHACWLRHARNERRAGGDGQFLELLRWVAQRALGAM